MKPKEIINILETYERILKDEDQEVTNHFLWIVVTKLVKIVKELVIEKEKTEGMYS